MRMRKVLSILVLLMAVCSMRVCAQEKLADDLVEITITYMDCDGKTQTGKMICNKAIEGDLREIFEELYRQRYPIEHIGLMSDYDNNDEKSMSVNNTSCYCYRTVAGTSVLSKHALGMAVDINPLYNPCVHLRTGKVEPANGKKYAYGRAKLKKEGKLKVRLIDKDDLCYRLFKEHGFTWGGDWPRKKDYQHFEK